mgnify:CR=1 FL=1
MNQAFLEYKSSRISYLRLGQGPGTVVCFHGYGETAASFSFLEKHAGADFTFLAIDLPFHGNTVWKEGLDCTPAGLLEILRAVLVQEGRGPDYILAGFSLGGRMALALYEADPLHCSRLVLLAPDGLKMNFWYWLATQTRWGNRFFKYTMEHPRWYFLLLKGLNRIGLVNASIFKFVSHYIEDEKVRHALYTRWTTLRKIRPGLSRIRAEIRSRQTPVRLLYGMHDRIILSSVGDRFRRGIEANCEMKMIHSGHQLLHEKHVKEILPALLR